MSYTEKRIAIIGGGPAGMMAAGTAALCGANIILLEKNNRLGVKLLMTGGDRCNITNKLYDVKAMASQYGVNGKFLISALTKFCPDDVIEFFNKYGVKTKIEDKGRVFPVSNSAIDILNALKKHINKKNITLKFNAEVKKIVAKNNIIEKIILSNGEEVRADQYIIATGGKSYGVTGSIGDAYTWLKPLGHTIIEPKPALCAVVTKNNFITQLQGLSLQNILVSVYKNNQKIKQVIGDFVFTHNGLSGPAIYNLSKDIGLNLPSKLNFKIDFFQDKNLQELDSFLIDLFLKNANKTLKNILASLLPEKLALVLINLISLDENQKASVIFKIDRKKIANILKNFDIEIKDLAGFEKATVTAGGVSLKEIDPKTMRSKIIHNLFLAGEVLDLDGPTGGYNLQVAWSTGFVAGKATAD